MSGAGIGVVPGPGRLARRSLPLLLAGIIAGAAVLTPAVGSAAAFLTRKKADKRYLGNSTIVSSSTTVPFNSYTSLSVSCPPGLQALSGGVDSPFSFADMSGNGMLLTETKPLLTGARSTGWSVELLVTNAQTVTVYAVCAP